MTYRTTCYPAVASNRAIHDKTLRRKGDRLRRVSGGACPSIFFPARLRCRLQ